MVIEELVKVSRLPLSGVFSSFRPDHLSESQYERKAISRPLQSVGREWITYPFSTSSQCRGQLIMVDNGSRRPGRKEFGSVMPEREASFTVGVAVQESNDNGSLSVIGYQSNERILVALQSVSSG
jgi:hypothetical protein